MWNTCLTTDITGEQLPHGIASTPDGSRLGRQAEPIGSPVPADVGAARCSVLRYFSQLEAALPKKGPLLP